MLKFLQNDDKLAFAAIYDRYRLDVYRFGITLVKAPDLAEDLVQDVFIKIWDARHRLEIKQSFRSYLLRVAHNRGIDMNKEISTKHHLVEQLVNYYQALPVLVEEDNQEDLQRYDDLVEEALNSLTPQRRKVYEMCKKDKKSYEEVARELDISPNTVKATMSQTLSLLRNYITKHAKLSVVLLLLHKIL